VVRFRHEACELEDAASLPLCWGNPLEHLWRGRMFWGCLVSALGPLGRDRDFEGPRAPPQGELWQAVKRRVEKQRREGRGALACCCRRTREVVQLDMRLRDASVLALNWRPWNEMPWRREIVWEYGILFLWAFFEWGGRNWSCRVYQIENLGIVGTMLECGRRRGEVSRTNFRAVLGRWWRVNFLVSGAWWCPYLEFGGGLTSRWLKCTPFSLGWRPRKTAFDWLRALETTISISRIARNIKHFLAPFSRNITSSEFKFRKRY